MTDDTVITVDDLSHSYGDVSVLDGVSFDIPENTVFGVLGPNGVGKTTLIKILTGQLSPTNGSVEVLELTPWEEEVALRKEVGILPEKQTPPSYLTPNEFFEYVGLARNIPKDEVTDEARMWAEKLGFSEKLDTLSTNLSRGQQQKVMFTQALLHTPEIVFIDEPVANLDPLVQERVKEFISEYPTDGRTVVLSTHHTEFAAELCDSILSVTNEATETLEQDRFTTDSLLEHFEETW